jgi:hypothetical protein
MSIPTASGKIEIAKVIVIVIVAIAIPSPGHAPRARKPRETKKGSA